MRNRRRHQSNALALAISLRDWKSRLLYIMLGSLAVLTLALDRTESPVTGATRNALTDLLAPAIHFLSQPTLATQNILDNWQNWQNVAAQNEKLRAENLQLRQWQTASAELLAENNALRDLLKLAPLDPKHFLSGRMIGNLAGSFSQTQFLDIGENDGVKKDMSVISGDGFVGRVMEVGNNTSRVMLVTDINSRIAVVSQKSREKAVAAGRNHSLIELRYLPQKSTLKVGELVLTSGDAKLIPAGMPVGRVVSVESNRVLVKPSVNWSRLSHVSLIAE